MHWGVGSCILILVVPLIGPTIWEFTIVYAQLVPDVMCCLY